MVRNILSAIFAGGSLMIFVILLSWAVLLTLSGRPTEMPTYAVGFISSTHAILVANIAIVLGISASVPGGGSFRRVLRNRQTTVQAVAAIVYGIALFSVFLFWLSRGFTDDPAEIVESIPELGRAFGGVAFAVLASVLGVEGIRAAAQSK